MTPTHLDAVLDLFACRDRPAPGSDQYLDYYFPILKAELRRSVSDGRSLCWYATGEDGEPVGAISCSYWELPLTGTPCALVDDIIVLPRFRRKGVAADLQKRAAIGLYEAGFKWIAGNIDSTNPASLRQALKAGRTPWSINQRVRLGP